jgi:hypothetical protein
VEELVSPKVVIELVPVTVVADCMVYFGCAPTVWYILDVSRLCGIFWMCPDCVVYFGCVPIVWYILDVSRLCGIFYFSFSYFNLLN